MNTTKSTRFALALWVLALGAALTASAVVHWTGPSYAERALRAHLSVHPEVSK